MFPICSNPFSHLRGLNSTARPKCVDTHQFSPHEKVPHIGIEDTLTELKSKYWVVHGRRTIRSSDKKCACVRAC